MEREPIQTVQCKEHFYSTRHVKCTCHHVFLKREHSQAQFPSQVKWNAVTSIYRLQGSHFNTCTVFFFSSYNKLESFVDMGGVESSVLKNAITFSTVGRYRKSKFCKILSQSWLSLAFSKISSKGADFSALPQKLTYSTVFTQHKGNLELGFPAVLSAIHLIWPVILTASFRHYLNGNTPS